MTVTRVAAYTIIIAKNSWLKTELRPWMSLHLDQIDKNIYNNLAFEKMTRYS